MSTLDYMYNVMTSNSKTYWIQIQATGRVYLC